MSAKIIIDSAKGSSFFFDDLEEGAAVLVPRKKFQKCKTLQWYDAPASIYFRDIHD